MNGPSSPVVSSAGRENAIVWVVETNDGFHSSLHAYDALTGESLFDSNASRPADAFDGGQRFTAPIVADGKVFVPAQGLLCFGALPASGGAQ
jgi:outer membrane protein assembly factor BamB